MCLNKCQNASECSLTDGEPEASGRVPVAWGGGWRGNGKGYGERIGSQRDQPGQWAAYFSRHQAHKRAVEVAVMRLQRQH